MTIVLCGGGSGGHITPLLAVASEVRRRHRRAKIIYIGERGGKFAHIAESSKLFDERHYVSAGKLRRYHGESFATRLFDFRTNILNIRDVFRLLAGTVQSYFLLRRLKPEGIMLKGGFVCVPVSVGARMLRIPHITHDSDALPGLSNRIAARWADYNATGQPAQYYRYPQNKIKVTGVPTDEGYRVYSAAERDKLRKKLGLPPKGRVLLITGGSNGARRLNAAMMEILPKLLKRYPDLHVLHQIGTGNDDQKAPVEELPDVKKRVTFFYFSNELYHMTAIADLVVTRAGASSMADMAAQLKACIVVPNPYLTGGHQVKNAEVLADAGAAEVVTEKAMLSDSDNLYKAISKLLPDEALRKDLGRNLHALAPERPAAASIVDLLEEISR